MKILSLALFLSLMSLVLYSSCTNDAWAIDNSTTPNQSFDLFTDQTVFKDSTIFDGYILLNQDSVNKFKNRIWQGMPSIGIDKKENLYAAWYTGGKGEGWGNYISLYLSKDKGVTWEANKLLIIPNDSDSSRVFDPSLYNDRFGNLYLGWSYDTKKRNNKKEWVSLWAMKITLKSGSVSFNKPQCLGIGVMLNKPLILSDSASMFFPIARWATIGKDPEKEKAFLYKGLYGKTCLSSFERYTSIPLEYSNSNFYEHMVVQLKNNTFLAMLRAKDGIYKSTSIDGKIWTPCSKLTDIVPTTSSRFHLRRLSSGNLILILNNSLTRHKMTAFLSTDDGKTWPYSRVIENNIGSTSYPDLVEDRSRRLYVVFDGDRTPNGRIYCSSFTEGNIIEKNSINISIIDKIR